MINQLQDFQVIIFLAFFKFIRWTQYRQQGGGGRERGEGMRQRAAGATQTQAGRSQPYGMWSLAQHTELNQRRLSRSS